MSWIASCRSGRARLCCSTSGAVKTERLEALQALSSMRRPDSLVIDAAILLLQDLVDVPVWAGLSDRERLAMRRDDFLDPDLPAMVRVYVLGFGICRFGTDNTLLINDVVYHVAVE